MPNTNMYTVRIDNSEFQIPVADNCRPAAEGVIPISNPRFADEIRNYRPGDRVIVKMSGTPTVAVVTSYDLKNWMVNVSVDGRICPRRIISRADEPSQSAASESAASTTPLVTTDDNDTPSTARQVRQFDINTRFSFLGSMVKMVATSVPTSLIITGPGGLGKSYTVFQTLQSLGLEENADFVTVKGFSTPKSLFRTLYENRDRIVVFDDCDSVLKNETAVNILKAALDSTPVRTVCWMTERNNDENENALPHKFEFVGKVIFISNTRLAQIPQALLSRALYVDVSMTVDEKIDRMRAISPQVKPEISTDIKLEVIDFMAEIVSSIRDFNIRTLLKVVDIRTSEPENWREIAEYVLTAEQLS